jgi:hypothetical protein
MHLRNAATKAILLLLAIGVILACVALLVAEIIINRMPSHDSVLLTVTAALIGVFITGFPGLVTAVMSMVNYQHNTEIHADLKADIKGNTEVTAETRAEVVANTAVTVQTSERVNGVTDKLVEAASVEAYRRGLDSCTNQEKIGALEGLTITSPKRRAEDRIKIDLDMIHQAQREREAQMQAALAARQRFDTEMARRAAEKVPAWGEWSSEKHDLYVQMREEGMDDAEIMAHLDAFMQ